MAETVVKSKAHVGISLDGDADRLIMADEKGNIVSGDQLMAILAQTMHEKGNLSHNTVVATHMSNLGFERFLQQRQINLVRTLVGDRYVIEEMQSHGYRLGGEQSGHLILSEYSSTGDGLLSALQILRTYVERQKLFSELSTVFLPVPQLLRNVRIRDRDVLKYPDIITAIEDAQELLKKQQGRLLVRFSGTEPVLRLMGEADDIGYLTKVLDTLEQTIQTRMMDLK
jgi:phosphoglucosamine mutase